MNKEELITAVNEIIKDSSFFRENAEQVVEYLLEHLDDIQTLNIKLGIEKVVNGESEEFQTSFGNKEEVDVVVESLGGKALKQYQTNGWELDWWEKYEINGKIFVANGSGYYSTLNFTEDDE
jgi:hypothetical protein